MYTHVHVNEIEDYSNEQFWFGKTIDEKCEGKKLLIIKFISRMPRKCHSPNCKIALFPTESCKMENSEFRLTLF